MMTYHVQFLLLVLAGWVNRQQQDVIDYLQEENRVLGAGLRGKRLSLSDDERRRLAVKAQALGREGAGPDCVRCHTRYASALVPPPHRSQVRWQQEPESQADLRRRRTSVSSLCAWRGRTRRGDIRACEAHSRTSDMNSDDVPDQLVQELDACGARLGIDVRVLSARGKSRSNLLILCAAFPETTLSFFDVSHQERALLEAELTEIRGAGCAQR